MANANFAFPIFDVTCPITSQPSGGAPSDSHIKLKPVEITVILAAIFPITANLWLWINALHGHSHVISLQTQTPLFTAEYCWRNDERDAGIKRGLFGIFQRGLILLNLFRCLWKPPINKNMFLCKKKKGGAGHPGVFSQEWSSSVEIISTSLFAPIYWSFF